MTCLRRLPSTPYRLAVIMAGTALVASNCSNKQRLGQYEYGGRTLALVTVGPPHPEVFQDLALYLDWDNPMVTAISVGSEVAREVQANRIRARLDSAAMRMNVSERMADRTLGNAARHLRVTPAEEGASADYELEVRVRRYGIVASSWGEAAHFMVDVDMILLDGATGRRIWKTRVRERDAIMPAVLAIAGRPVTNVVTAIQLATMSTAEIERALESLADYAADRMLDKFARALDDVRG